MRSVQTATATAPIEQRPVDLAHLARQTMGNRDLEREVLHLFLKQSESYLARFDRAGTNRAETAHVILGSARGIGATAVARAAEAVEAAALRDPTAGDAEIAVLRREIATANRFIRSIVFSA